MSPAPPRRAGTLASPPRVLPTILALASLVATTSGYAVVSPLRPGRAFAPYPLYSAAGVPSENSSLGVLSFEDAPPLASSLSPSFPPRPLRTLWRFTRPHTLIGSMLAVPATFSLALPGFLPDSPGRFFAALVRAAVPALLMNLYITGLNQVTDVEIDAINKPDLVIPAGDLRMRDAKIIVAASGALGLLGAYGAGSSGGLRLVLWGSALLGTAYSLPPLRLKRFPLLAATSIVAVRGALVNVGFYHHALAASSSLPPPSVLDVFLRDRRCLLSSLYFGIFGIVIALMKDVPDVRGDARMKIRSFSVRRGPAGMFRLARRIAAALFVAAAGGFGAGAWRASEPAVAACRAGLAAAAAGMGTSVRRRARGVDPEDGQEVYDYYMYLWKLFYASYFALPLAK